MERHERTFWGFVTSLAVIGILAMALVLPWWTYTFSTGLRTAPGGPQPEDDTRIERERWQAYPFRSDGISTNATADNTGAPLGGLGYLVVGSMIAAGLVALLEIPVPFFFSTRWVTLVLVPIGFLLAIASLLWGWFVVPEAFAEAGVNQAFTSRAVPDGYVRTWIDVGWMAGFVAVLVYPAIFALKYQAGATDPTIIELFRKPPPA